MTTQPTPALLSMTVQPTPALLSMFKIEQEISDDPWNRVPMGAISCRVYDGKGESVGDFNYRIKTGQVGGIFVEEPYRRRGLEQQMLMYMMKDMQDAGAEQIWEVAPDDTKIGRVFYSRLWSFAYKNSRIHPSVSGGGYAMDIPHDIRALQVVPGVGAYERGA